MDYKALNDFNKYTLALSGAGAAYVASNYDTASSECEWWFILAAMVAFIVALLSGLVVFGTATSKLHDQAKTDKPVDGRPADGQPADGQQPSEGKSDVSAEIIMWGGIVHLSGIGVGALLIGFLFFSEFKVVSNQPKPKCECCCSHEMQDLSSQFNSPKIEVRDSLNTCR